MIKLNELRIGNLVYFGVLIVPIKSIHIESFLENETSVYVKLNDKLSHYCLDIKDVSPIPLTEEILLKCGFEYDTINASGYLIKPLNTKCIDGYSDYLYIEKNQEAVKIRSVKDIEVKYLHQLQNLYFALTNEELEVKL